MLSAIASPSLDLAYDRLPARLDMDVLNSDLLLALSTMLVECLQLPRIDSEQFLRVLQFHIAALRREASKHRPSKAFHGGAMRCNQLHREHSLNLVFRLYALECSDHRFKSELSRFLREGLGKPEGLGNLS